MNKPSQTIVDTRPTGLGSGTNLFLSMENCDSRIKHHCIAPGENRRFSSSFDETVIVVCINGGSNSAGLLTSAADRIVSRLAEGVVVRLERTSWFCVLNEHLQMPLSLITVHSSQRSRSPHPPQRRQTDSTWGLRDASPPPFKERRFHRGDVLDIVDAESPNKRTRIEQTLSKGTPKFLAYCASRSNAPSTSSSLYEDKNNALGVPVRATIDSEGLYRRASDGATFWHPDRAAAMRLFEELAPLSLWSCEERTSGYNSDFGYVDECGRRYVGNDPEALGALFVECDPVACEMHVPRIEWPQGTALFEFFDRRSGEFKGRKLMLADRDSKARVTARAAVFGCGLVDIVVVGPVHKETRLAWEGIVNAQLKPVQPVPGQRYAVFSLST